MAYLKALFGTSSMFIAFSFFLDSVMFIIPCKLVPPPRRKFNANSRDKCEP